MFSRLKVALCLLSILTKSSMSTINTIISRIQDRYLWSVILEFSQLCFRDSLILVYCRFNSYFMFITKEKLHLSLTFSFYCCLLKEAWALKVASQLAVRGLVAYKPVAYKKLYSDMPISVRVASYHGQRSVSIFENLHRQIIGSTTTTCLTLKLTV